MKTLLKTLSGWFAVAVGLKAGGWLWDEVLEEKADDLKNRLSKKCDEEQGF